MGLGDLDRSEHLCTAVPMSGFVGHGNNIMYTLVARINGELMRFCRVRGAKAMTLRTMVDQKVSRTG